MDRALASGDAPAALEAWGDALHAAMSAGRWEALVEVGDAYQRIGAVGGNGHPLVGRSRQAYLLALSLARRQDCLHCVLRVAEAFAALGDREHLEQSLRIAGLLAAQDPEAEADVRALAMRFAPQLQAREE
jgi:hypothetical protein